MKILVIACKYRSNKDKDPSEFRLLETESKQVMDVPYQSLLNVLVKKQTNVLNATVERFKVKATNGSFDRYSRIVNDQLDGTSKMVIIREIGSMGYEVCDHEGHIKNLRTEDALKYAKQYGIANGKVVTRGLQGKEFISPISGVYETVDPKTIQDEIAAKATQQAKKAQAIAQSGAQAVQPINKSKTKSQATSAVQNQTNTVTPAPPVHPVNAQHQPQTNKGILKPTYNKSDRLPSIVGTEVSLDKSRLKEMAVDGELTIEQKLARGYLVIKNVKSFYYAVLQTIKRKESVEIDTMAVSIDTLYYNSEFVKKLALPMLIFVEMHEVSHMMMKHYYRRGLREPKMWNIACDLFINKMLCDEFNIKPGSGVGAMQGDNYGVGIQFADGGLYDERIDTNVDTPESIYAELEKESEKTVSNKQVPVNQPGQQGQQGQGQQGQGQGQQQQGQGQVQQGQMGQGQQGQGRQGQIGQNQGQPTSNPQGSMGQGGLGQQPGQSGQQQGNSQQQGKGQQGQPQNGQGQQDQSQNNQGQQGQTTADVEITETNYKFRGRDLGSDASIDIKNLSDIIDDQNSKSASDTMKKGKYDSIMKKAKVLEKQMNAGKGKGNQNVAEAFVDEELVPKINWRTLLMNRLVAIKSDEKSLSTPDRRFVYAGTYIEGNREEDEQLRDIKIGIDTSGSMSDEDIAIAFMQIKQLLKTYKVDAEIIFWDDGIQDICPFDDFNTLKLAQCRAMGRGGTDPNCVFELFEKGKEYKLGLRPKPELIMMFTDGIFSGPSTKYKSKYGRDTLWIISGGNSAASKFNPPFGKVAKFKVD